MKEAHLSDTRTFGRVNRMGGVKTGLKRKLTARHISMIAIGGSIGTGLFLGSGATIHQAGPGGALVAYGLIGFMVYLLMTSLGEMGTYMPVTGSFNTYATKFVDPAFGFAIGWIYWLSWATTIAVEASAAAILMKFWLPDVPSFVWSGLFLLLIFTINFLSVKNYGEAEYWLSMIKVVAIIVFLIAGFMMVFGIMSGDSIGTKVFLSNGGPMHGGILAVIGIFMIAGFSFQGTEIVGIVAGESKNPEKNIPKAIKQVFWRILLFYMLSILVIGLIVPFTDKSLLNEDVGNIAVSPFTLVFERAGIAFAASLMNAVILSSVFSAGNSGLYASARMLYTMAKEKQAPAVFAKLNKNNVPIAALIFTLMFGLLAFLSSFFGEGKVFMWLLNISGLAGFIAWAGIAVSHYRFRRGYIAQGHDLDKLVYKAKWFPLGPLLAAGLCIFIIIGQNYEAFIGDHIDWRGIAVTYIGIPIFLALWFGYKYIKKTKWIKLKDIQF